MDKGKSEDYINYISFSNDGKKILFDRQKGVGPYMINVYDLVRGELRAYESPTGEKWSMARYSFDGKHIVFSVTPIERGSYNIDDMQLAVMSPEGKNIKRITNTNGPKIFPSFSHAGDKVIFAKAGTIRKSGHTPATDFDVYEVDINTGKETRLTRFNFFELYPPFYFSNDKAFIYSAGYPKMGTRLETEKMRKELSSRYKENTIYVMQGGEKDLKPYFEFNTYSSRPLLSADGKHIFFESYGDPLTKGGWTQYYHYSPEGRHRCITNKKGFSMLLSGAVSADGELLAVVYDYNSEHKIVVYQVKDGTSKEISLPDQPSHIINRNK